MLLITIFEHTPSKPIINIEGRKLPHHFRKLVLQGGVRYITYCTLAISMCLAHPDGPFVLDWEDAKQQVKVLHFIFEHDNAFGTPKV